MNAKNAGIIKMLMNKGVAIFNPESIEIGKDVNPDRISGQGVVIYSGCKIFGNKTLILKDAVIGREAPATIENCQIGPGVKLNGGFFKEAVFLKGASVGSCAHVREGTIFEESAGAAHSVGVKQTILFPWVTLGSQINFCDCLMAGGTGKKNHSEVGSSYIHFNFTPQQDKATPSLIGDVPAGVMLNQSPIFLGGQGGLVGPCRLAFGVTIAAGTILRKDELRKNRLIFGGAAKSGNIAHTPGAYSNAKRILDHNVYYIASLLALKQWYQHVRILFISEEFPQKLFEGALDKLELAVAERIKRLNDFIRKISEFETLRSGKTKEQHRALVQKWPKISETIKLKQNFAGDERLKNKLTQSVQKISETENKDYLKTIQKLSTRDQNIGTLWLQGIVDDVANGIKNLIEEERS